MDFSTSLPFSKVLASHRAIFPTVCVPGSCCPHVRAHPAHFQAFPGAKGWLTWPRACLGLPPSSALQAHVPL